MKIEVGKTYLTRGGWRATIERLSGINAYPYEGRMETENQTEERHEVLWNSSGRYINMQNEDEDDLVKECP